MPSPPPKHQLWLGMEPWAASPEYFQLLDKAAREGAEGVLKHALLKLKATEAAFNVSSKVIAGSPRQVIVDEAERWDADLVVMGSWGLGTWNRLLLGSVSSAVLNNAKCSVEIVRRPGEDAK